MSFEDPKDGLGENSGREILKTPHIEAVEFVEKHRDFFEHYAGGAVKFLPAPEGLDTFAFDLNTNSIYISPRFFIEKGYSSEKTIFAVLHELEHFFEKKQILSEDGGQKLFEKYLEKIKKSGAYSTLDNHLADIRENKAVTSRTSGGYADVIESAYSENLFPSRDFTSEPKHLQFSYALLREAHIKNEECVVAPEVRERINKLKSISSAKGVKLWDVLTHQNTPMSTRLKLQDKYVLPLMEELKKQDLEEEKEKRKQEDENKKQEKGDGDNDNGDGEGNKGDKNKSGKNSQKSSTGEGENVDDLDPDEVFKEAYKRAKEKMPNAVSIDAIEKAFEDWKKENAKNKPDPDKEYAEKLGVKKEDLQKYRKIVQDLEKVINPETNENIVQDLSYLIERIISKRLKPKQTPKYPEPDGEDLVDPAQLVADVKSGNFEPKVWETLEVKQMSGNKFGEVEITLVCDRSGSMMNPIHKLVEQRKSAVFLMEALKNFADRCDEEKVNMEKLLEVRSEVYSFQNSSQDATPLKAMSKELREKDRIDIMGDLSSTGDSTTDFVPLEKIYNGVDDEIEKKIGEGELKKIIIVFTDGGSDDTARVQKVLNGLRSKGVIVIGVGVTESGKPSLQTYAPDARLAEKAEMLSPILADLLKEHLQDI